MFMPSEIARLVLGYLKDAGCARAVNVYLTENAHLSEYVACLKMGREYPTTIAGQSLTDILQEYCRLKAAERMPQEMGQIVDNIEENLAQIKCLATNGQIRTTPVIASSSHKESAEKSSVHPMLLGIVHEQENIPVNNNAPNNTPEYRELASATRLISTATNTDTLTDSRQRDLPQQVLEQRKTVVDSSTQCSEDPLHNNGFTSALRANDILESPSQASTSSSTQTPNRSALRSWTSTPSRRQVDFYSSPSSMVKSAMLYNFGVETFRTPAKDRYLIDTPLKDKYLDEDGTWKSPRRKNQVPRKRLSYTPLSALKTSVSIVSTPDESEGQSNDNADFTIFIDNLLHNTALHEKIADNINKVVSHTTQATITNDSPAKKQAAGVTNEKVSSHDLSNMLEGEQNAQESAHQPSQIIFDEQMLEAVIKDIVDRTESDPLYEASLNMFYDKHECTSHDSQTLGACSDYAASPDTHGTPLSAVESIVPSSVATTQMSENADTPKSVIMPSSVDVIQEPPDSSGIAVVFSNGEHCHTPISEISSHYATSTDQNMESPCQNNTSPYREVSSEALQSVSSQSVTYSQIITNLPPNSGVNTVQAPVQLPSTSVLQNVLQLQYTNAPSVPSVQGGSLPYFSNVVPTINQSKLPTIFFPFYPNAGTIIGPVMTTLPVPAPSALPACASLQKDNSCAAPVQYFKLNSADVMTQSNSKSFTHFKIGPSQDGQVKSATTIRATTSVKDLQKKTKNIANKQTNKMCENGTPYQVPQAASFVEVTTDIVNSTLPSSNQECSSKLSELLCLTSSDPAITLYGQDMQEHRVDNLAFQKLLSNTSISVAGKLLGLTPVKASSTMQFITLSPGPIMPITNATSAPPKTQTSDVTINSSKPAENQHFTSQRANVLQKKPTTCKTVNHEATDARNDVSRIATKQNAKTKGNQRQKTIVKPLDFGEHLPAQKPVRKKQMLMMGNKMNITSTDSGNKTSQQHPSNSIETRKSSDCSVITISKGIARSMPVLDNLRIITTTRKSHCTGSSEKSPQLTSLLQSANLLKVAHQAKDGEQAVSHVRALDFGGPLNSAGKEDSQKRQQVNDKSVNSQAKSKDTTTTKKPSTKPNVGKAIVKNSKNSKRKVKTSTIHVLGNKSAQSTQSESKEESSTHPNGKAKAIAVVASSSPCPKKRTASQANLSQKTRTPAKKLKGAVPGKVLSVMDIERFLSGLHYEQE